MRPLVLVGVLALLFCCGCNALYQFEIFRRMFGKDEDEVDTLPFLGAWVDAEHMTVSRAASCAAVGTTIYVCGGENDTGALDLVEAYDTTSGTWSTVSSLPAPTSGHACVACDGKVYVLGGTGDSYAFDPGGGWSGIAEPQPTLYACAAACSGRIYCFGGLLPSGYTSASTQVYDPVMDSWSQGATMPDSRAGAFCAELGGTIYVVGGYHNPQGGPIDSYVDSIFEYDPVADAWIVSASVIAYPRAYGCCGVVNGRLLVVGGFDGNYPGVSRVEAYTPVWNLWQDFWGEPSARSFTCGAGVGGRFYVFGGKIGTSTYTALAREFISPF
jgi:N-acetylneuraminic acid mutarotase